jgi:predicted O-linked N-acetylglucosamine transferase (SPINDLY family)
MMENQDAWLVDACGKAMDLQLAGQLGIAEEMYRSILETEPTHAVANHCLGMIKVQMRRPAEGLPLLLAALNAHPEFPDYWLGYLEALLQAGQVAAVTEALALGRQHGLAGRAVEEFALRLATARSIQEQSDVLMSMIAQNRLGEALHLARSMTEHFPDHGFGWKSLGALLWGQRRAEEAVGPMRKSVQFLPLDAEAHSNFGVVLLIRKQRTEALQALERAIEIDPRFAAAHYHLGLTYLAEHRFAEAEASLRTAVELRPDYLTSEVKPLHSDLLFLFAHNPSIDADTLFAEHRRFGELLETPPDPSLSTHMNSRDPDRRLRIGFVSGDLRDHSVAKFLGPIVARLAEHPRVDLHAYSNNPNDDAVTARLRGLFAHWHTIATLDDAQLAKRIESDGIDILIDLHGHTGGNRLRAFARKPAPVQVSWLGYPATTGLRAMDYYIADRHWLPPGQFDHLFTEKLAYLPDRWAFQIHPDTPAVNPLPAPHENRLTFGSFHRASKLNESTLAAWCALMRALPTSRLLLADITSGVQQCTLTKRFAALGIAADRLWFHERCPMSRYLALHHHVDIALDAHPYGGGTTTMHSLSMGVPTLTVAGRTSAGRAGAGIMTGVGLEGFVAANVGDFVAKGVFWSGHISELATIRAQMRDRLKQYPGGDPSLIAAHLEAALRHMWRRWCAGLAPESFHSSIASDTAIASSEAIASDAAQRAIDSLMALIGQKHHAQALTAARQLVQRVPANGIGWKILGGLLWANGSTDEALAAMYRSTQLLPQDAEAHCNLAIALAAVKRLDEVDALLHKALAIDPACAAAHYRLGMQYEMQGRYRDAETSLRTALSLRPKFLSVPVEYAYSNLLFLLDYNGDIDAESLFVEHRQFGELIEVPLRASWPRHANLRDQGRRLQVALVSADFHDHPVAAFLEPVLARLAESSGLELHAYSNRDSADGMTARLRGHIKHWHPVSQLAHGELAKRIMDDGIDVLFDLSGHTAENRLPTFARKPAPVQVSWLGYPGTTGLGAIDYYLADQHWLPPGRFDHLFTEKLVYLPHRWAFKPHPDAPAVNALPALESECLTFGSFHRASKITAHTIRLWSELLLALPQARLILAGVTEAQGNAVIRQFAAHGIAATRLSVRARRPMGEYLALHHDVDIALDAFPYAGGTTTMHSLSMGVPTLTLAGGTAASRAGAGVLAHAGLDSFVADNVPDFVERARYWSAHLSELAVIRSELRTRWNGAPGGQPRVIAAHLEGAIRHMWRRWCAGLGPETFHSSATGSIA